MLTQNNNSQLQNYDSYTNTTDGVRIRYLVVLATGPKPFQSKFATDYNIVLDLWSSSTLSSSYLRIRRLFSVHFILPSIFP